MRSGLIIIALCTTTLSASSQQLTKNGFAISGSLSFLRPSTAPPVPANNAPRLFNNYPFTVNAKASYFLTKRISIGLEGQLIQYSQRHSGPAALQPPGISYTDEGRHTNAYISFGLSGDAYLQLGSKIYIVPSLFIHYLYNRDIDKGQYYENGQPAGISYSRQLKLGYFGRLGTNFSLLYYVKPDVAIVFRPFELETRFRTDAQEFLLSSPLLIGAQFHLFTCTHKK